MNIPDGSNIDYAFRDSENLYVGIADLIGSRMAAKGLTMSDVDKVKNDCKYFANRTYKNIYAWGWLGKDVPQKGWNNKSLQKKVISILKNIKKDNVLDHYCGFHTCEICGEYGFEASIKIQHNNKVYCCPRGVEHYIDFHDYKPADEVINAILNGHFISTDDILDEFIKKYPKEIEKQRIKAIKDREEKRKVDEEIERKKQEYRASLTPQQRNLIDSALNHNESIFIPL